MKRPALGCVLAIAFTLCLVAAAFADQESEVRNLVDTAVGIFKAKGTDYAVKLLNSGSGPFRKGELYVFATAFDGTMLAHASNRDLVGSSQFNWKDAKGVLIFPPMLEIAKNQGSGWVEYWWLRHAEKEPTLKRTYIRRVPGQDILLGAGYFIK